MLLWYCLSDFEIGPVAPLITVVTFASTFHILLLLLLRSVDKPSDYPAFKRPRPDVDFFAKRKRSQKARVEAMYFLPHLTRSIIEI
jgi:hypothetical protein